MEALQDKDVAGLTLDEYIGQTLMVGCTGLVPSPEIAGLIQDGRVGGIILFGRNCRDARQVRDLTARLQTIARDAGHRYPLLIAIDEENGVVRCLGAGTALFPGNMTLGAIGAEDVAEEIARAAGRELRALGITMNLAPVVDVSNNPANPVIGARSFGDDPAEVARLGSAVVRGYRDTGILTALKHFPGHGDTSVDSHRALPSVTHTLERLEEIELAPFRAGIAAGSDAVMVAHVAFPGLTSGRPLPSTVAPAVVQGLLRERLGFSGTVISDCLEMNAVAETIGTAQGAVMALRAGIDLVLVSHRHDRQWDASRAIRAAVEDGTLPREVVEDAARRVLRLKARGGSWNEGQTTGGPVPAWVGGEAHRRLAQAAYERAITLVRDDSGLLPLRVPRNARLLVVYPDRQAPTRAEENRYPAGILAACVRRRHMRTEAATMSINPSDAEQDTVMDTAADADLVLVETLNAHLHCGQAALVRRLLNAGKCVVGIAARDPYDLLAFPDLPAYLCAYEYTPPALEAATRVLFGEIAPRGHLPVTLPGLYERGHELRAD